MKARRLTESQIVSVKELLIANNGRNLKKIGAECQVSVGTVFAILHRIRHESVLACGFDDWADMLESSRTPMARFLDRVVMSPAGGCWNWIGSIGPTGYALAPGLMPGEQRGNRVAFRLFKGDIPAGKYVLHKCNNRACVNPDHMYAGTQKQNVADAIGVGTHVCLRKSGTEVRRGKLTVAQVIAARKRYAAGESQPSIAADFGVSRSAILSAVNGHTWKHIREGLDA